VKSKFICGVLALIVLSALAISSLPSASMEIGGLLDNFTSTFRGFQAYLDASVLTGEIRGTSMAPTFDFSDTVFWVSFPIENVQVGDIIIWESLHENIVHRVIEVVEPGLVRTQGDNMGSPDRDLIDAGRMRGLVIGVLFTSSEGWHG